MIRDLDTLIEIIKTQLGSIRDAIQEQRDTLRDTPKKRTRH